MNFSKFTEELMCVLEIVTSLGATCQVYLHTGRSVLFAIAFWLSLLIAHSIHLMLKVDGKIYDDQKIQDALAELNPWWFAINSLIMIGLSNI